MIRSIIEKAEIILDRVNGILTKVTSWMAVLLVIGMTCILGAQVVARYVLNSSIFWSEEFARYCFVWVVFLCAAIGFRDNRHICITTFVDRFPQKIRWAFFVLVQAVLLFFLFYLIKYGYLLSLKNHSRGHVSPALQMPMWIVYSAVPVGGLLIVLHVLQNITNFITAFVFTGAQKKR